MEFITTQKGEEALIWQGCKFTLNHKMANDKRYWRCGKRSCPARITTEGDKSGNKQMVISMDYIKEPKRR